MTDVETDAEREAGERWCLSEGASRRVDAVAREVLADADVRERWAAFDRAFVARCLYASHGGPGYDGEAAQAFLVAENAVAIDAGRRVYEACVARRLGRLLEGDAEALDKLARVYAAARRHLERHAPDALSSAGSGARPVPPGSVPPIVEVEERAADARAAAPAAAPPVRVRAATPDDAPALRALLADVFAERRTTSWQFGSAPEEPALRTQLAELATDPRACCLVAERGGVPVGLLDFRPHAHPQRTGGRLGLVVRGADRRTGVGAELVDALRAWADEQSVERLEASVFATNAPALALLASRGFVEEGRRPGAVRVGGEPVDLVELARR